MYHENIALWSGSVMVDEKKYYFRIKRNRFQLPMTPKKNKKKIQGILKGEGKQHSS
jgi:hypothetical protein